MFHCFQCGRHWCSLDGELHVTEYGYPWDGPYCDECGLGDDLGLDEVIKDCLHWGTMEDYMHLAKPRQWTFEYLPIFSEDCYLPGYIMALEGETPVETFMFALADTLERAVDITGRI